MFASDSPPISREKAPESTLKEAAAEVQFADMRGKMEDLKRSASEYFPMIKRGFVSGEELEEEAPDFVAVGWKHDVASRKDREESLR